MSFSRFITQHVVDKFENRLYENEVYTRIFLSENIFTLLETYMKINELLHSATFELLFHTAGALVKLV